MPKSLFVDPVEVRAPGKVTFNDIPVNQYNILKWSRVIPISVDRSKKIISSAIIRISHAPHILQSSENNSPISLNNSVFMSAFPSGGIANNMKRNNATATKSPCKTYQINAFRVFERRICFLLTGRVNVRYPSSV